jgi:hypothetical protein
MIFWIIVLSAACGVLAAGGSVIKEYQRRKDARNKWDEFKNTKDF